MDLKNFKLIHSNLHIIFTSFYLLFFTNGHIGLMVCGVFLLGTIKYINMGIYLVNTSVLYSETEVSTFCIHIIIATHLYFIALPYSIGMTNIKSYIPRLSFTLFNTYLELKTCVCLELPFSSVVVSSLLSPFPCH